MMVQKTGTGGDGGAAVQHENFPLVAEVAESLEKHSTGELLVSFFVVRI